MSTEAIGFTVDSDGNVHFLTECQPLRTIFDPEVFKLPFISVDEKVGRVTIKLDGRAIYYDRIGFTLKHEWICDLDVAAELKERNAR
jgi:hypothetical protein